MGHTTDFLGHIDIDPSLNHAETAYLTAFARSRRFDRPGGPYEVPDDPRAETGEDFEIDRYNAVAIGQPSLWCDWEPCGDGCCLAFNGTEEFYEPVRWLRYLVTHFLKPGAKASSTALDQFAAFTFDHRLNGIVVGCRRDNKELFAINVTNNRVTEKILRPADQRYVDRSPLPYETAIDRGPKRRRRRHTADVIPISRGRTVGGG